MYSMHMYSNLCMQYCCVKKVYEIINKENVVKIWLKAEVYVYNYTVDYSTYDPVDLRLFTWNQSLL